MSQFKVGDIVARKSYGFDILFKVADITETEDGTLVTLKGTCYRIEADAPESDLVLQSQDRITEYNRSLERAVDRKMSRTNNTTRGYQGRVVKKAMYRGTSNDGARKFSRPGKVLHIDGDSDYLEKCMEQYRKMGIDAVGRVVAENEQPAYVYKLLEEINPDILVLTGHDGMIKGDNGYKNIDNYRNTKYFIASVQEARRYQKDMDSLVIFAGACQSMYSGIINAGANYASAPERVLIHALDPVFVCQKIAFSSVDRVVAPNDVISKTITGAKGIGGVQTRGKYRDGYPADTY